MKLMMMNRWWENYKFTKLRINNFKVVLRRVKIGLWEKYLIILSEIVILFLIILSQ